MSCMIGRLKARAFAGGLRRYFAAEGAKVGAGEGNRTLVFSLEGYGEYQLVQRELILLECQKLSQTTRLLTLANGADPKHAKLAPKKKYRLNPGQAGIYQDGTIHSIDYPDSTRFIRVTGTDLDKIPRIKVDLKTGAVAQMYTGSGS